LITPLKNKDIGQLSVGDEVYLSGRVCTARDKAHERALQLGEFPADIEGGVIFHAGPVARKEKTGWSIISIGPTTSSRMNRVEAQFIDRFGIKAIIGKGGMNNEVAEAMKGKAVYLAMTGGCSASMARHVKKVCCVHWLDLGMPEAVWCLEVDRLGPLVVAIDSKGNSLYEEVERKAKENLGRLLR